MGRFNYDGARTPLSKKFNHVADAYYGDLGLWGRSDSLLIVRDQGFGGGNWYLKAENRADFTRAKLSALDVLEADARQRIAAFEAALKAERERLQEEIVKFQTRAGEAQ